MTNKFIRYAIRLLEERGDLRDDDDALGLRPRHENLIGRRAQARADLREGLVGRARSGSCVIVLQT